MLTSHTQHAQNEKEKKKSTDTHTPLKFAKTQPRKASTQNGLGG